MNTKVKIALILIVVFALDLFIGAMVNRAVTQHRIRSTFAMHNPLRFPFMMTEIVQPDPDQETQIREILGTYAKRIADIRGEFAREMRDAWLAMKKELDSVLTPEQKKRLEENAPGPMRRFRRPFKKHGDWRDKPPHRGSWRDKPPDKQHERPFF